MYFLCCRDTTHNVVLFYQSSLTQLSVLFFFLSCFQKSVIALRQLMPNAQSFIQQCVQQTSSEVVTTTCTTTSTPSPVVTTAASSIQPEKPVGGSEAAVPGTVSIQTLKPLAGPGGANTGVVTLHSVGPAAVPGGTTAGTVVLQTPKPLVTSLQNTVTTVSLQPEKPVVSGTAVTLALPSVPFGKTSAAAVCLPSVKPVLTSAGTTSDKPVLGPPLQIKLTQPGPVLAQPAGIPQAVKVKQLVSNFSFLPQFLLQKKSNILKTGKTSKIHPCVPLTTVGELITLEHVGFVSFPSSHRHRYTPNFFPEPFKSCLQKLRLCTVKYCVSLKEKGFFFFALTATHYHAWEVNTGTILSLLSQQVPLQLVCFLMLFLVKNYILPLSFFFSDSHSLEQFSTFCGCSLCCNNFKCLGLVVFQNILLYNHFLKIRFRLNIFGRLFISTQVILW